MAPKNMDIREGKVRRQREWDESFSSLRRFLADPVVKQALGRLKKKDPELAARLDLIEANVKARPRAGRAPSEAEEALLEQIFGKPTEEEQKAPDAQLEEWLIVFRDVEKQFDSEWKEKTGEALVKTADKALYKVKSMGKDGIAAATNGQNVQAA